MRAKPPPKPLLGIYLDCGILMGQISNFVLEGLSR